MELSPQAQARIGRQTNGRRGRKRNTKKERVRKTEGGKEAERKVESQIRSSSSGNNNHHNDYHILAILHVSHLSPNGPEAEVFHFHFPDEETELRESK